MRVSRAALKKLELNINNEKNNIMPSLISTTFTPFELFAQAKSSEGALFIFSPSKHAPVFAFWIFYSKLSLHAECIWCLNPMRDFWFLMSEEASGSQGQDA